MIKKKIIFEYSRKIPKYNSAQGYGNEGYFIFFPSIYQSNFSLEIVQIW